jgi:hypothetical protein
MACANAQHVVGRGSGLGMSAYMVAKLVSFLPLRIANGSSLEHVPELPDEVEREEASVRVSACYAQGGREQVIGSCTEKRDLLRLLQSGTLDPAASSMSQDAVESRAQTAD